mgnify:CR=1 FL=1
MSEPAVGWLGDAEAKPAPEPLTRIQALINTVDLESGADRLAEPADARPWLVAHGLLAADGYRAALLGRICSRAGAAVAYEASVDTALDALATHLERCLDLDRLLSFARAPRG